MDCDATNDLSVYISNEVEKGQAIAERHNPLSHFVAMFRRFRRTKLAIAREQQPTYMHTQNRGDSVSIECRR